MADAVAEIQQVLNWIRGEVQAADWQLRLEVLELLLSTSERVVADVRKMKEPEQKQIPVPVPQTQVVKRRVNMPAATQQRSNSTADLDPIAPQPPLPPQQTR